MSEFATESDEPEDFLEFEGGQSGGPPVGTYVVELSAVKATDHPQWGAGVQFRCTVMDGEHQGSVTARTGKPVPTGANISGRLIAGILGRGFKPGEKLSLKPFIGKTYSAVVGLNKDGESTRLEKLTRIPGVNYDG